MPVLTAILILIIGWIIVKLIVLGVSRFMLKNKFFNDRVLSYFDEDKANTAVNFIKKAIYYLLMLFVVISALQVLGLSSITQPLNSLLNVTFAYIPQVLGAILLLLAAWLIATLLKKLILVFFNRTKLDEKLEEQAEPGGEMVDLGSAVAELVYWAVFILFLPAILSALSMGGLLAPIQNMVNIFLAFIPNLFGAGVLVFIGYFIAKIFKNITTKFFKALKVDDFGKKYGLTVEDDNKSLSEILGMVVYLLILIPIIISALKVLGLESIAQPATEMLSDIFTFIPVLFSATIIVAFAYFIGKMVGELTSNLLSKIGFDRVLPLIGINEANINLPNLCGKLITILIVLVASLEAAAILGFAQLSNLMEKFVVMAGNVLVGVVIVGFGLYIANLVADLIQKSGTKIASMMALVAKVGILVLAASMGLSQMGLAPEIIMWAFISLVGALAVSFAIAFGMGGKDFAAKRLLELEEKMKQNE